MTIHNITNFPALFRSLDACSDPVTMIMPDGRAYDWGQNQAFLRSFFQTLDARTCRRLELRLGNSQDVNRMLCYLIEGDRLGQRDMQEH